MNCSVERDLLKVLRFVVENKCHIKTIHLSLFVNLHLPLYSAGSGDFAHKKLEHFTGFQ